MKGLGTFLVIIWFLNGQLLAGSLANQGNYLIRHYEDATYLAHPVNWVAMQDQNGKLYVGNRSVVLAYDGLTWEKIKVRLNAPVYDMKPGRNGKIYLATEREIAYLANNPEGKLEMYSLMDAIPDSCKNFVNNWKVHVIGDTVYFQSNEQLIRLVNDQFDKAWQPKTGFHFSYLINDQLYITVMGKGLMKLQGDSLKLIDERFAQDIPSRIYAMTPMSDGKILLVTRALGVYTLDPGKNDQITQLTTSDDRLFTEVQPYGGTVLADGRIAINTLKGGVIIMDEQGRIVQRITMKNGLKTNDIRHVYQDNQGGLWLSTNSGVYRIAYDLSLTYWDKSFGLEGSFNRIITHQNYDYVATSRGVFQREGNDFRKVKNLDEATWYMITLQNGDRSLLVAASTDGLYEIDGMQARQLTKTQSTFVYESPKMPGVIWSAEGQVLKLYQLKDGELINIGQVPVVNGTALDITVDHHQNTWVGTKGGGLFKISPFSSLESLLNANVIRYGRGEGISQITDIRVKNAGDSLVLLAGHRLFIYQRAEDRFAPLHIHEQVGDTTTQESIFLQVDEVGSFWVQRHQSDYTLPLIRAFPKHDTTFMVQNVPFKILPRMLMRQVLTKPDGAILILTSDALICYEVKKVNRQEKRHRTLIRRLVANQDIPHDSWITTDSIAPNWGLPRYFPYLQNDLTFWFNAICLRSENHNMFQYKLEGDENKWSEWSNQPVAYFTNLREGDYRFLVRCKGFDEVTGITSVYEFTISPPWYRSVIAYICYVLAGVFVVWSIVKLNTRRIRKSKDLLEVKVAERTAEIVSQNIKIKSQQAEIMAQNEELQMLNKEKNYLLGAVAHDLKNPLNAIYSVSQLIKMDKEQLDEEQLEYIEQIESISLSLTDKVNEILDVTVIDAKQRTVPLKRGEVSSVVKEVVKNLQPVATRKNIVLCLADQDTRYFAFIETNLLKKALQNLLDNAIKFSPSGKRVFITICHTGDRLRISVRDEGPGISHSDQEKLFQRFTTLSARPTNGEKSTGLGLSIVKRCVEAMNGNIRCESKPGEGADFIIEL